MSSLVNLEGKNIILASNSPRRKDLMQAAGFEFSIKSKNVDETHPPNMKAEDIPSFLAQKKARAFALEINPTDIVIGADTIVLLHGRIYEKPTDHADAVQMLMKLSGQIHEVITGVCILTTVREIIFSETTKVHFNTLSPKEIEYYVAHYKPFDKAGAYACQEWIGAVGIKKFEGDYFNVVGLPINRVYHELKKF